MANLPQPGDTNWGATLNTWLIESRNPDGTIKNNGGSNGINNITVLSQAAYDALTPDAQTLYIIT